MLIADISVCAHRESFDLWVNLPFWNLWLNPLVNHHLLSVERRWPDEAKVMPLSAGNQSENIRYVKSEQSHAVAGLGFPVGSSQLF